MEKNKSEAKKRIEKLKEVINYHRHLYHVEDKTEISDAALDSLKHELWELEQAFPEFVTPDSPTQRVGGEVAAKFTKVKHPVKQMSLNDIFTPEEFEEFDLRVRKGLRPQPEAIQYVVEAKIDGLHIVLTYKKGLLVTAATRGDGTFGEELTANIKTIEGVPLRLTEDIDVFVEGEVWLSKKQFEILNKEKEKKGETLFANPRNAAAGGIRQLDSKEAARRKLDFFAYVLHEQGSKAPETQEKALQRLLYLGFKVNKGYRVCKTVKEVEAAWQYWQTHRSSQPFLLDGVVVKVNDLSTYAKLGFTGKAPRFAIAFKFPAEQVTTIVHDIIVQVGRTGALTPVAIFQPVSVAGSTITRATLHNADEIARLGIRIGDTVIIQKAGDVIPEVVKVLPEFRSGKEKVFHMPNKCPMCGSPVEIRKGEVAMYCSSKTCAAKRMREMDHFVSRKAFNVEGLGPAIIEQLFQEGLVSDVADLFELTVGDLQPLERFAEKKASNIVSAVQSKKEVSTSALLYALGIRHIGIQSAQLLAKVFQKKKKIASISDLMSAWKELKQEDLDDVHGIGPKLSAAVLEWWQQKENQVLLQRLEKVGVKIRQEAATSDQLAGKTFVLTGSMPNLSREEATQRIEKLGGHVSGSVSAKTSYVVAGEDPGSKFEKAKKLGVSIIDEAAFLDLLKKMS